MLATSPASAESRLDLPEPTWPSSSTSSPGSTVEVDVADADGAVVVHRGEPDQLEGAQRVAGRGRGRRGRAVHQVDARRAGPSGRRRRRAGWWSCIQARVPGASVMTEPATRPNQSNPLTAPATSSAVASPQPPASRTAHAATTPHCTITIGHAVEQRLHPVLADGGVDAAAVDLAQVRVHARASRRRA